MTPNPSPLTPYPARARLIKKQAGAALLTALVVVGLVATLAAGMVWQQWRAVQVESAERARVQAYWVLNGALDWARMILQEDGKSDQNKNEEFDYLGEPWATPLAEARLSTFLAVDKDNNTDDAPEAFLSGQITDEQSRFNLATLYLTGELNQPSVEAFRRLCELTGVPGALADTVADNLHQAMLAASEPDPSQGQSAGKGSSRGKGGAPFRSGPSPGDNAPLMPASVDQLGWLGIPPDALAKLRPYITLLPPQQLGHARVNLNTAPKEVIAAMIPGLDLASAERLVKHRQEHTLKEDADVQAVVGHGLPVGIATYASSYFSVEGRLRFGDRIVQQRFLVYRSNSHEVTPVRQERSAGVDSPATGGRQQ
jgi:general secretion pathway protein K